MKKNNCFRLTLLAAVMIILPLAAFYPDAYSGILNMPKTGQTISYAAGDDGDLQTGVDWPDPRFTNPDGSAPVSGNIVLDQLTGLYWERDGSSLFNYLGAISNCEGLNISPYSDFRLPNMIELESLNNAGETDSGTWLNAQGFQNIQNEPYWSSNAYAYSSYDTGYRWFLNLSIPQSSNLDNEGAASEVHRVLCVRGGANGAPDPAYPSNVRKSGAVRSVNNYDDGWYERGVTAWEPDRFIDMENGTMLDILTGLQWTKNGNMPSVEMGTTTNVDLWADALAFIDDMNNGTNNSGLCGADNVCENFDYTDWRLPNFKELWGTMTYWDDEESINELEGMYGFEDIGKGIRNTGAINNWCGIWTSTTDPADTNKVYSTSLGWGGHLKWSYPKDTTGLEGCGLYAAVHHPKVVWPVRTGPLGFTLTVIIDPSGAGTTTNNPLAPPDGYTGEDVDVTPTPNTGYTFAGWGGCNTDDLTIPCTMTMNNFKALYAYFDIPTADLSVAFGNVYVGTASTRTVTVKNDGITPLVIDNIGAVNGVASPFSLDLNPPVNPCGTSPTLASGDDCDLIVGFTPAGTGLFRDSFNISDTVTVNVTGTGVGAPAVGTPDIAVSDYRLYFLNTPVSTSDSRTFTVMNEGGAVLTINSITGPLAPFAITNNTCGATLGAGANCAIEVTYTADAVPGGPDYAGISIASDDPDENPVNITLMGSGIAADNRPPVRPVLQSPANGATGVQSISLTWTPSESDDDPFLVDPDGDTVNHTVYYSTDPSFEGAVVIASSDNDSGISYAAAIAGNPVFMAALFGLVAFGVFLRRKKIALIIVALVFVSGLLLTACGGSSDEGGESATGNSLQAGQTYYWMVVADDGRGGVSASEIWSFTTSSR